MKKFAFTLAEVLVTLGVIGVVAAMTIPTLIKEHKKSVIETRLKHTVSILQQAETMRTADNLTYETFEYDNPEIAFEIFNKYYAKYIKLVKVEKGAKGVFGYLPNGVVLYFRRDWSGIEWANTWVIICITDKACKNLNENIAPYNNANGKDIFPLYTYGNLANTRWNDEQLYEKCRNNTSWSACMQIIRRNGWKIPKDYPIRL